MNTRIFTLNEKNNVTLTCYIHDNSPEYGTVLHPSVLVLPGGGYALCSDREAEPVALAYAGAGYNAFVLRYTLKTVEKWPAPLNDYEQAMELIKAQAEEWHCDKERIAVAGFSAGGHLAACAATIAKNKPAATILGYGALENKTVRLCDEGIPVPVNLVDKNTAPCFLFGTRTDNVAPCINTVEFTQKLFENGIAFESHIYSYGPHGYSTGASWLNSPAMTKRAKNWLSDSIEWLEEIWGEHTVSGFTEPKCKKTINGNADQFLSTYCTYEYLLGKGDEATEILKEVNAKFDAAIRKTSSAKLIGVVVQWNLCDILPLLGYSADDIKGLDRQLGKINNY